MKNLSLDFTLFPFDVFFDDTDVHFSSCWIIGRAGVAGVGGASAAIGGDALFTLSDSDVRNLKLKFMENITDYMQFHNNTTDSTVFVFVVLVAFSLQD